MAKKRSTKQDQANESITSADDQTPINQEIRLAETKPGEIEALENSLDELEELNLTQEVQLRQQAAEILLYKSSILSLDEALDKAIAMIKDQQARLDSLTSSTTAFSNSLSRKEQVLALMLPDGPDSVPGPHVSIAQLAAHLNTNNKNVSSILTPLRDMGYAIMTDEAGMKYISSYDPKASYKASRSSSSANAITSDDLVNTMV